MFLHFLHKSVLVVEVYQYLRFWMIVVCKKMYTYIKACDDWHTYYYVYITLHKIHSQCLSRYGQLVWRTSIAESQQNTRISGFITNTCIQFFDLSHSCCSELDRTQGFSSPGIFCSELQIAITCHNTNSPITIFKVNNQTVFLGTLSK